MIDKISKIIGIIMGIACFVLAFKSFWFVFLGLIIIYLFVFYGRGE